MTGSFTSSDESITPEKLIERLQRALRHDGDFPASAKIVSDITTLTNDPKATAQQLTELILQEPSIGIRILNLVNSSYYKRSKPIITVSQAVVQIGMRPLADMCSTLVLVQKFIPAARQGGPLAGCLRKTIITSLLSNSLTASTVTPNAEKKNETGHLLGWLSEMGTLLLAYYFPTIYENAKKREAQRKIDFSEALNQIIGLTPLRLSIEVLKNFELPSYFRDVLNSCEEIHSTPVNISEKKDDLGKAAASLHAARSISQVISAGGSAPELDAILQKSKAHLSISATQLNTIVGSVADQFKDYCATVDLSLPALPEHIASLKNNAAPKTKEIAKEDDVSHFLEEIRQSVNSREPTASILTSTMEALAWGIKFDRVLLLLLGQSRRDLVGRMSLGNMPEGFDPTAFVRTIDPPVSNNAPEIVSLRDGRPVFRGTSILPEGWPFCVIPIGFGKRCVGIIYADKVNSKESELDSRDQATIAVLAELLDRSISSHRG